jgi:hypothetical protein
MPQRPERSAVDWRSKSAFNVSIDYFLSWSEEEMIFLNKA